MIEIKTCPCCGERADTHMVAGLGIKYFWIECKNKECKLSTKQYDTKIEAIMAWNRRTHCAIDS